MFFRNVGTSVLNGVRIGKPSLEQQPLWNSENLRPIDWIYCRYLPRYEPCFVWSRAWPRKSRWRNKLHFCKTDVISLHTDCHVMYWNQDRCLATASQLHTVTILHTILFFHHSCLGIHWSDSSTLGWMLNPYWNPARNCVNTVLSLVFADCG
jgi:hypothetical protein